MGVTFIHARALEWMVPEVERACHQQLADLTTYRASVAAVIACVSSAHTGGDVARSVKRAYLLFFLPFWWEHVLLRGALAPDDLEKEAKALRGALAPDDLEKEAKALLQPVQPAPEFAPPAPPPPPPAPAPALPPPQYHAPPAHPWPPL